MMMKRKTYKKSILQLLKKLIEMHQIRNKSITRLLLLKKKLATNKMTNLHDLHLDIYVQYERMLASF